MVADWPVNAPSNTWNKNPPAEIAHIRTLNPFWYAYQKLMFL